jgi:hypothetical protein
MRAYIDSDIMIWHLRGERKAARFLRALSREQGAEPWTGVLQRAEVVFFMRPDEASSIISFLSRFKTAPSLRRSWTTPQSCIASGSDLRD